MRTSMAVPALAVVLALSGCGEQALIGDRALDPVVAPVSAEEAQQEAARLAEEGAGESGENHGGEDGSSGGETGEGAPGSGSASGEATAETGQDGAGGETSEAQQGAGTDEGGGTVSSGESTSSGESGSGATGSGGAGSGGAEVTESVLAQFEQQFPAVAAALPEETLRSTATQVCSAIATGGTAAGETVVEDLPGVTAGTAAQVVGFFDREVCTG